MNDVLEFARKLRQAADILEGLFGPSTNHDATALIRAAVKKGKQAAYEATHMNRSKRKRASRKWSPEQRKKFLATVRRKNELKP